MNQLESFPSELADRFAEARLVGCGGMGAVWAARQRSDGQPVAVKVLLASLTNDEVQRARFRREAALAQGQFHEAIVRALDYGEVDGLCYIVYEYVDGETLEAKLKRQRPMPVDEVMPLVAKLAACVGTLHAAGIVHRDIKPSNVMIEDDGAVRLLDLGVARVVDEGRSLTDTGIVLGTPHYMSPELICGEKAHPAADVYAIGALAVDCLAEQSPFEKWEGRLIEQLTARAVGRDRLAIPAGTGAAFGRVLRRALAFKAADRYRDGQQLLAGVEEAMAGAEPRGATVVVQAGSSEHVATTVGRRGRLLPMIIGIAVVVLAILALSAGRWGTTRDATVRHFVVEVSVNKVVCRWQSQHSYRGAVELSVDGSGVTTTVHEADATAEHAVTVRSLAAGSEGTLRIVFPWGERSLPRRYRTKEPSIALVSVERGPKRSMLLRFTTEPAARAVQAERRQAAVQGRGAGMQGRGAGMQGRGADMQGRISWAARQAGDGSWSLVVPGGELSPPAQARGLYPWPETLRIDGEDDGSYAVAVAPLVAAAVEEISAALPVDELAALGRRFRRDFTDHRREFRRLEKQNSLPARVNWRRLAPERRQSTEALQREMRALVGGDGGSRGGGDGDGDEAGPVMRCAALAPLLFAAELVPLDDRLALRKKLEAYWLLESYLFHYEAGLVAPFFVDQLGELAQVRTCVQYLPLDGTGESGHEGRQAGDEGRLAGDEGRQAGRRESVRIERHVLCSEQQRLRGANISVDDLQLPYWRGAPIFEFSRYDLVEVKVTYSRWRSTWLRLTFNGVPFHLAPPTMLGSSQDRGYVVQRLPIGLVRRGANTLSLALVEESLHNGLLFIERIEIIAHGE